MSRLAKPSGILPGVVAALSMLCLTVSAAKAEQHKCLRVFDATAYVGKPDLGRRGIEVVNAFEPDRYWPKGAHDDDLPDPSAAQTWRAGIAEVIVVENGGNRASEAVCGEFSSLPIRYFYRDRPLQPGTVESVEA